MQNEEQNVVEVENEVVAEVKEKRQIVRVSDNDFIKLLMTCVKENKGRSQMASLYKERFGAPETTALQRYSELIKQYRSTIDEYEKKDKTDEVKNTLERLNKGLGYIQLKDGRIRNNSEEGKLNKLLEVLDMVEEPAQ